MKTELVKTTGNKCFTTSLIVAEEFEKRHDNLMAKIIDGINSNNEEIRRFSLLNFKESKYVSRGKEYDSFEITEDGFAELAMSFTGDKARVIRIRFIAAFRKALNDIDHLRKIAYDNHHDGEWVQFRVEGKEDRRAETDVIKEFVAYAHAQGSKSPEKYYMLLTKMMNEQLFVIEGKPKNIREVMGKSALRQAQKGDSFIEQSLMRGMAKQMHYKEVFQEAKADIIRLAERTGKIFVPLEQKQTNLLMLVK
jgi:Rha family phage regulatory protein